MDHLTMPLIILGSVLTGGGMFMAGALFGAIAVYMSKYKGPFAEMPQNPFKRDTQGEVLYEGSDSEDNPIPNYEDIYQGINKYNIAIGKENMPEVV